MKKSILFVIDGLEFGGGEKVFLQIIEGLNKEKYYAAVASWEHGEFGTRLKEMGIPIKPVNMENRFNPFIILRLASVIRKGRFHIVHSQGARADFFARMAVLFAKGSHLVCTVAMPVEGFNINYLKKKMYGFFDRVSEKYVGRFIVVSDVLKKKLVHDHKIPASQVIRIYNGIELTESRPQDSGDSREKIRSEHDIKKEDYLLGAVGRLVWQKGFEYLIRAAKDMPDSGLKILLVGEGPLRPELQNLAVELGVQDKIIFAGFRKDVKNILSAIDVLAIPSLQEGFPMVTLEAMAMKKPVIAARIDGITEQIKDNQNGLLVPPKNAKAIAEAVVRLMENRDYADSLGIEAGKFVEENFPVEKMVSETERVYESL